MRKAAKLLILVVIGVLLIGIVWFLRAAGPLLVVDQPQQADTILILAGDQDEVRFHRGVQLLHQGYANNIQMDANNTIRFFGKTNLQWGEEFIAAAPVELRGRLSVCGIPSLSTLEEMRDAQECLRSKGAHKVLLVTSDFHTRRSIDIARHAAPQFEWSVAAAPTDVSQPKWWRSRTATKNVFEEWQKLLWWKLVESHVAAFKRR